MHCSSGKHLLDEPEKIYESPAGQRICRQCRNEGRRRRRSVTKPRGEHKNRRITADGQSRLSKIDRAACSYGEDLLCVFCGGKWDGWTTDADGNRTIGKAPKCQIGEVSV